MEQTRIVVAVVLSFLILLLYQMFFVEKKTTSPEITETDTIAQTERMALPTETPLQTEPAVPGVGAETVKAPESVTVTSPLYQVRISEKGAVFQSFKLKQYTETTEENSELKELIGLENPYGTLINGFSARSVPGIDDAVYTYQSDVKQIDVTDKSETISFRWQSRTGVAIEKSFIFSPDSYLIDIRIVVENRSGEALQDRMTLSMMDSTEGKATRMGFTGPSAMVDKQVQEVKIKKLDQNYHFSGTVGWTAFQDRYFLSTILPAPSANTTVDFVKKDETMLESRLTMPEKTIPPNSKETYNFQAYFGPKNISLLKSLGHQLERVVDFGWFDWFARPCLMVMNMIYSFIPNYGVAIILLTLLIKALLWPLGNKSYKSMGQMKKMQPLMAEIRERYKDDKQKMNMELMSLYKTYKVNPMGGCLPMFVQIPVLYGLYRMLYQAVELRHAPFMGWITDLSAPERLFHFGFAIPMMEAPYGIPVLTILMGLSMLIQQKMQPPMGDAAQAKMMMFMPLFFVFICINISSGLVLYWLVSQIISILQQYYVTKKTT